MSWIDGVEQQLSRICNGDVSRKDDVVTCKMDNGEIKIWETKDRSKIVYARKGELEDEVSVRLEMHPEGKIHDVPVITKSLNGSIELVTRQGRNPSAIIVQEDRKLGRFTVESYNIDNKMMLEAYY